MKVCCNTDTTNIRFYSNRFSTGIEFNILIEGAAEFRSGLVKKRGRKHSPGEKLLMQQVAEEFGKKLAELGARKAAKQLSVSVPSFYNYVAGTDLPRTEVLWAAHKRWRIDWKYVDLSQFLRSQKVRSAKQLAFSFLEGVREEDVEVSDIGAEGETILRVLLKIRFPA
jgi:hypothetical protein